MKQRHFPLLEKSLRHGSRHFPEEAADSDSTNAIEHEDLPRDLDAWA